MFIWVQINKVFAYNINKSFFFFQRFLEINDNEDNLPVRILEGYNITKTPEKIPNDINTKKDFPERKFSNKKPRKFSDDKKRKKSIFKGIAHFFFFKISSKNM